MRKIATFSRQILLISCLTSCSEETQTVDWYVEHPEILAREFGKCKIKTLTELSKDKHCSVIIEAQQRAFHERQRNAPLPDIKFK